MTPETVPRTTILSTRNHSGHFPLLTYDNLGCLYVTFNLTVDLKHAAADDLQSLTMIMRSFPMIDFSPPEVAVIDRRVSVRGTSVFGAAEELRVNMKAPKV